MWVPSWGCLGYTLSRAKSESAHEINRANSLSSASGCFLCLCVFAPLWLRWFLLLGRPGGLSSTVWFRITLPCLKRSRLRFISLSSTCACPLNSVASSCPDLQFVAYQNLLVALTRWRVKLLWSQLFIVPCPSWGALSARGVMSPGPLGEWRAAGPVACSADAVVRCSYNFARVCRNDVGAVLLEFAFPGWSFGRVARGCAPSGACHPRLPPVVSHKNVLEECCARVSYKRVTTQWLKYLHCPPFRSWVQFRF